MPGITAGCKESSCLPGIGFSKSTAKSKMSRSQILQSLFRQAVQGAKFRKRLVFLDLFCGDGGVSKAIRRQGFAVVSIDINNHPKLDLCAPDVQKLIFGWIRSRCIIGVWLATPCTTWSRARHGPVGSSWGPLCDKRHLFGLRRLSPKDCDKIRTGNATALFTLEVTRLCQLFHVPCLLENPSGSMLWKLPKLIGLCDWFFSVSFVTYFLSAWSTMEKAHQNPKFAFT